jgi:predicted DNA-binding transcriptional regulator YafY
MSYQSYTEKLKYLLWLIEKKSGNAKDLSDKLEISERTLKRMIAFLKEQGYDISFNRTLNSYLLKK